MDEESSRSGRERDQLVQLHEEHLDAGLTDGCDEYPAREHRVRVRVTMFRNTSSVRNQSLGSTDDGNATGLRRECELALPPTACREDILHTRCSKEP